MKYLDAELDPGVAQSYLDRLSEVVTRPWTVVDFCGGPMRRLLRNGIDRLLPEGLCLRHGPGCPFCLVPVDSIELAIRIGRLSNTVVCISSDDLLDIPGRSGCLLDVRARGGDVRVVYSPLAALALARATPKRQIVYVSVGFETTAPAASAAIIEAERLALDNLSMIVAHPRTVETVRAVLNANKDRAHALLAPGHVSAVIGLCDYHELARSRTAGRSSSPAPSRRTCSTDCTEPSDSLRVGEPQVENQYGRAVRTAGNPQALASIAEVFEPTDVDWRGLGSLSDSGLKLRERFRRFDAWSRFSDDRVAKPDAASAPCREVLIGRVSPVDCREFGRRCSPEHAIGPAMLTAQGACAAYYRERALPMVDLASGCLKGE